MRTTRLGHLFAASLATLVCASLAGCGTEFATSDGSGSGGSGGSTTTTTTTAIGGGGAGGAATGGQGGGTGNEDCTNGIDDDGDQLADCADPNCNPLYACISVPGGWSGPVLVAPGVGDGCSERWPTQAFAAGTGVTAGPPVCSCGPCSSATNIGCSPLNATFFMQAGCQGQALDGTFEVGQCDGAPAGVSIAVDPPQIQGNCAQPAEGTPSNAPTLTNLTAACAGAVTGGGCSDGVCAPAGGGEVCIYRTGDQACPVPGYVRTLLFTSWLDQRSCKCSCQIAGNCTGSLNIYEQAGCGGVPQSVPANGGCVTLNAAGGATATAQAAGGQASGTCLAHANPSGNVTPAEPVTLCCLP